MHIVLKILRLHVLFTGQHLIYVAADGVDLAVVNDKTVRMSSHPAWIGVGTETGMYDGNGRLIILILKVRKEQTQLAYQEHTFVYNGPAA